MNRKQFWLRYLIAFSLFVVAVVAVGNPDAVAKNSPTAFTYNEAATLFGLFLLTPYQLYLLYRRSRDVGYSNPFDDRCCVSLPAPRFCDRLLTNRFSTAVYDDAIARLTARKR
jgi:uncharacterized membrane protein YhaH (DUF805 family)